MMVIENCVLDNLYVQFLFLTYVQVNRFQGLAKSLLEVQKGTKRASLSGCKM